MRFLCPPSLCWESVANHGQGPYTELHKPDERGPCVLKDKILSPQRGVAGRFFTLATFQGWLDRAKEIPALVLHLPTLMEIGQHRASLLDQNLL